jgi:hypothetical protein
LLFLYALLLWCDSSFVCASLFCYASLCFVIPIWFIALFVFCCSFVLHYVHVPMCFVATWCFTIFFVFHCSFVFHSSFLFHYSLTFCCSSCFATPQWSNIPLPKHFFAPCCFDVFMPRLIFYPFLFFALRSRFNIKCWSLGDSTFNVGVWEED